MGHASHRSDRGWFRLCLLLTATLLAAALFTFSAGVARAATTGSISGTVKDQSGDTLVGISVSVYPQGYSGGPATGTASSASDGTYTIDNLAAGSYWVEFYDATGTYASQIYNDHNLGSGSMDYVTVTAGSTTSDIDAALQIAGKISGTVTDPNGIPLTTVWACVYVDGAGGYFANAPAGVDGTYTIGGLAPGSYNVEFIDFADNYASQWYDGQADQSGAAVITVSGGRTTSAIDAVMQPDPGAVIGPMNAVLPAVSGTAAPGQTLSCSSGTWSGQPVPTYTYQWLRDGEAISEATSADYQVQEGDCGHTLSCQVTATNDGGSAIAASNSVDVPLAPRITIAPQISGTPALGDTLSCTSGTWEASPSATYAYQWLRNGQVLAGAVNDSYLVRRADCGQKLSCQVTATNSVGHNVAGSGTDSVRAAPLLKLAASRRVVTAGALVSIRGTVRHSLAGARKVCICRRLSGRLIILRRLTLTGSGVFRCTWSSHRGGLWRFVARYTVAGYTFTSKAVSVVVRKK